MEELKEAILEVIGEAFVSDMSYPDSREIFKRLKLRGIDKPVHEVLDAIDELEKSGKIARAPHYFVADR